MEEVVKFIENFKKLHKKELEEVFTCGNCYWFALILKERFHGTLYYLPVENHFLCRIYKKFYDIKGLYVLTTAQRKNIKWWEGVKKEDRFVYDSIVRDCINLETR